MILQIRLEDLETEPPRRRGAPVTLEDLELEEPEEAQVVLAEQATPEPRRGIFGRIGEFLRRRAREPTLEERVEEERRAIELPESAAIETAARRALTGRAVEVPERVVSPTREVELAAAPPPMDLRTRAALQALAPRARRETEIPERAMPKAAFGTPSELDRAALEQNKLARALQAEARAETDPTRRAQLLDEAERLRVSAAATRRAAQAAETLEMARGDFLQEALGGGTVLLGRALGALPVAEARGTLRELQERGQILTPEELESIGIRTAAGRPLTVEPGPGALGPEMVGAAVEFLPLFGVEAATLRGLARLSPQNRFLARLARGLQPTGRARAAGGLRLARERALRGAVIGAPTAAAQEAVLAEQRGEDPIAAAALSTLLGGALGAAADPALGVVADAVRRLARRGSLYARALRILGPTRLNEIVEREVQRQGRLVNAEELARKIEDAIGTELGGRGIRELSQVEEGLRFRALGEPERQTMRELVTEQRQAFGRAMRDLLISQRRALDREVVEAIQRGVSSTELAALQQRQRRIRSALLDIDVDRAGPDEIRARIEAARSLTRETATAVPSVAALVTVTPITDEEDERRKQLGAALVAAGAGYLAYRHLRREIPNRHLRWWRNRLATTGERGDPFARAIARTYLQVSGLPDVPAPRITQVDPTFHETVARAYHAARSVPDDPFTRAAYRQLAAEIDQQYKMLEATGIRVVPSKKDPYPNSAAMIRDVVENRRLKVYASELSHPLLTDEENFKFRAVHDFFGYAAPGNQFGPAGEENAYREHRRMFSELARQALATETRGQNSWVNFGPFSRRPPKERPFAEQKAFILPQRLQQPYGEGEFRSRVVTEPRPIFVNIELTTQHDPRMARWRLLPVEHRRELRQRFIDQVVKPIARDMDLPDNVQEVLGSWFAEGEIRVTEAARAALPPQTPDEVVREFAARVSRVARQSGFFAARPDPEGPRVALELDFGRALNEDEYTELVTRLSQDARTFSGATMVRLGPARVQIVLNPGLTLEDGAATERVLAARAPEYDIRSARYYVRTIEGYDGPDFVESLGPGGLRKAQSGVDFEAHRVFERIAADTERLLRTERALREPGPARETGRALTPQPGVNLSPRGYGLLGVTAAAALVGDPDEGEEPGVTVPLLAGALAFARPRAGGSLPTALVGLKLTGITATQLRNITELPKGGLIESARSLARSTERAQRARAIRLALREAKAALKEPKLKEGASWYRRSVQEMERRMIEEFPDLERPENMRLFKLILAITSVGQNPVQNLKIAAAIWDNWRLGERGTKLDAFAPGVPRSKTSAEWQAKLNRLQSLIEQSGGIGPAIDLVRREALENDGIVVGFLGPKTGRFWLNLMGHDDYATVDVWMTRTWRRWLGFQKLIPKRGQRSDGSFGVLQDENGNVIYDLDGSPTDAEHRMVNEVLREVASQLSRETRKRLRAMDVQALLWYYEKNLYAKNGAAPSGMDDFGLAARRLQERRAQLQLEPIEGAAQLAEARGERIARIAEQGFAVSGERTIPLTPEERRARLETALSPEEELEALVRSGQISPEEVRRLVQTGQIAPEELERRARELAESRGEELERLAPQGVAVKGERVTPPAPERPGFFEQVHPRARPPTLPLIAAPIAGLGIPEALEAEEAQAEELEAEDEDSLLLPLMAVGLGAGALASLAARRIARRATREAAKGVPQLGPRALRKVPSQRLEEIPLERRAPTHRRPVGVVEGDYAVQFRFFNLPAPSKQKLLREVTKLKASGEIPPKRRVSFAEMQRVASELGFEDIRRAHVNRDMDGTTLLALRNVYKTNDQEIGKAYKRLGALQRGEHDLEPDAARREMDELLRSIDELEKENRALLRMFVPAASEFGRNLNSLKALAKVSLDPFTWRVKATRIAGRELLPEEEQTINHLVNTGNRAALVRFLEGLAPKVRAFSLESFVTLRRAGLLTGLRTQVRNFLSNTGEAIMRQLESPVTALMDRLASLVVAKASAGRVSGLRTRVVIDPIERLKASARGAADGVARMRGVLSGELDRGQLRKLDLKREVHFENRFLDAYVKFMLRVQGAADQPFRQAAFMESLREQAALLTRHIKDPKARAARIKAILERPPDDMVVQAIADSEEAVFQNANAIGGMIEGGKGRLRQLAAQRGLIASGAELTLRAIEWFVPFTQTPGAVFGRLVERTPIGLVSSFAGLVRLARVATNGEIDLRALEALQRDIATRAGRATVGTVAILLGMELARRGLMSGAWPDDPTERQQWIDQGKTSDAIMLGGKWRKLTGIAPLGNLLALGAQLYHDARNPEYSPSETISAQLTGIGRTVLEQSFLRGTRDFIDALQNQQGRAAKVVETGTASLVPILVRDFARVIDPVVRDPQNPIEALKANIPGLSFDVPARLDELGRVRRYEDDLVDRLIALFDPFLSRTPETERDPIVAELVRTGAHIARLQRQKDETDDEFRARKVAVGNEVERALVLAFEHPGYKQLATEDQAEVIRQVVREVRATVSRYRQRSARLGREIPLPPWEMVVHRVVVHVQREAATDTSITLEQLEALAR